VVATIAGTPVTSVASDISTDDLRRCCPSEEPQFFQKVSHQALIFIVRTLYGCYICTPGTEINMRSTAKRRDDRLEFRLPPRAKAVLKRAADVENKSLSAFLLDKGLEAAAETLAERAEFRLSGKQFEAFAAALDAPVKARPRLEKLLTTPTVLE
jgi:uncharacterized protein (DUF1778 family)